MRPSTLPAALALAAMWSLRMRASGVQYRVTRRLNGEGDFTLLDTVGSVKKYTDKPLPFGLTQVDYIVVPVRNSDVGPAGKTFSLQFGSQGPGGGGLTIASSSESSPVKMAA